MASEQPTVREIADEIVRYLADHPDAADTLEGIQHWWLSRQRWEPAATQVQRALDWLVEHGLVEKRMLPDGQVVYTKPRDRPSSQSMH
jgi:Fe2+ or Zn2+ uptake regulation protein